MSEWKTVYLEEVVEVLNSKRKPLNSRQRQDMQGEYPYYGASGIFDYLNEYIFDGKYLLVSEDGENLRSRQTPIAFIVEGKFWVNNHAHILKGKGELMDEYLELYFQFLNVDPWITGAVQPKLNKANLLSITVDMPVDEQERIQVTKTLYKLNDKITLLREQNQTLEELAQTLFKRWFVEFEFPNENGQPYKSSGGKMVESELGEIPEGWRVGEVADFVNHSTKSVSPSKEPNKIFSHYSIPAFDSGRYPTKDTGESILSNKYEVLENSILVSKLNPSTSRIWTVFQPCENGICSTEIQVFVPNTNAYAFSFGLFHYSGIKREMAQRASGTSSSHQRVRPGDILNIEFVVPREEILKKFEDGVLGSLKKIEENQEEIQSLTQLRNTLLPKLMSGELRVKE